ncbi:MAG: hypothetical protein IKP72_15125 [Clostridia bacterium]|nr:hypothetical protein [Clostridia bacterium]
MENLSLPSRCLIIADFPSFFKGAFGARSVFAFMQRKKLLITFPRYPLWCVRPRTTSRGGQTNMKRSFLYTKRIFMRNIQGIFFEESCFLAPPRADFQKVKQNRIKVKNIFNGNEKSVLIEA